MNLKFLRWTLGNTGRNFKFTALAAVALLLAVDALLHAARRARIFAGDLAERRAGGFLLPQRSQRLAEPQQRIRRARRGVVLGGDCQEGFGGVAKALALEQALAEPVLRIGDQTVVRVLPDEAAQRFLGKRV